MSLEQKFKLACEEIRKFSKRPPNIDMLEIYALYKQATIGNINTTKPLDQEGKAKWEAWNGKKGLNQNAAMEMYVIKVKALAGNYS